MRPWLKIALLVALAGLGALWLSPDPVRPSSLVGAAAPRVSLPDLDGRQRNLSAWRGRALVVNFWASWCAPCLEEMPDLVAVWTASRGRCLDVVGIAGETGRDEAAALVERARVGYPVLLDREGEATRAFGVLGFPETYLVDAEGTVRTVLRGRLTRAQLEAALAPIVPATCPGGA